MLIVIVNKLLNLLFCKQSIGQSIDFTGGSKMEKQLFFFQDTEFSIQIHFCAEYLCKSLGAIYEEPLPFLQNKFTWVTFQDDKIFVVQDDYQLIKVYETKIPFRLIYTIQRDTFLQFNLQVGFSPSKVFVNKKVSQLIFIQSGNSLLLGQFKQNKFGQEEFVLFHTILLSRGTPISVLIGLTTFFVVQTFNGQDFIEEYNYQQLQRIYKTKNLELFHYQLEKPLTIYPLSSSGWLFARANDGYEQVILIYEPGLVSHNCLRRVLSVKEYDFLDKAFYITVDGGSQMFLYSRNNLMHRIVCIFQDLQMQSNPTVQTNNYVNKNTLSQVLASNFLENETFQISNRIQVLNTLTNAFIKQSFFDNNKKTLTFLKQSTPQNISMGIDWYSGQITNFAIACQSCQPLDLSIILNVNPLTDGLDMIFEIYDGVSYTSKVLVYQASDSLVFQDLNGKFKNKIELRQMIKYGKILVSPYEKLILSSFFDIENYSVGIEANRCENEEYCKLVTTGYVTASLKISKFQYADEHNIIVLCSDPDNLILNYTFINIVEIVMRDNILDIGTYYTIDEQILRVNLLQIGDFDVIEYQFNNVLYSTILFTEINNGLYFMHFALDAGRFFVKTTFELFNLKLYSNDQYYVNDDTKFYQVKVISNKIVGTTLQLMVLITTNNAAHYVFYFELNASQPNDGLPIIKSQTSLQYILTPYGTWQTINKLAYVDGHVAIPYSYEQKIVIGIYTIPKEKTSEIKTIPFSHGLSADYKKQVTVKFALLLTKEFGTDNVLINFTQPFLHTNINFNPNSSQHLVQKYELLEGPSIVLKNSQNYADEVYVSISAMNDFSTYQGKIKLTVEGLHPDPDPDPFPDSKNKLSNWWWITLIIILVIIILLALGRYIHRKRLGANGGINPLLA